MMKLSRRASGLLLHPTSLPGGDLGPEAFKFADFLEAAGQKWWQMLPVSPPDPWNSPYQSLSSFAGNTNLISVEKLGAPLREAFRSFRGGSEFDAFRRREKAWLEDFARFMALREAHQGAAWTSWENTRPDPDAVRFYEFAQFIFFKQWSELKAYCGSKGIGLIGDLPIYVAHDSAEVWANPDLFKLDERGLPTVVAGVPPDYFSETGQRWGNPIYRWDVLKRRHYDWWLARLQSMLTRFDAVRLDHFIGFHRFWEIPASSKTAKEGEWRPGPGSDFFKTVFAKIKGAQIIAEDLGSITPEVEALRDEFDLPGMRVIQFMFGPDEGVKKYQPHNFSRRLVVYTGTHDNDTLCGWLAEQAKLPGETDAMRALAYAKSDGKEPHWDLIRLALESLADTAILPVQDILGLGSEARMNRPGTDVGNWQWRLSGGMLTPDVAKRLRAVTEESGR
jgi:4-alpha-glucanotransferase